MPQIKKEILTRIIDNIIGSKEYSIIDSALAEFLILEQQGDSQPYAMIEDGLDYQPTNYTGQRLPALQHGLARLWRMSEWTRARLAAQAASQRVESACQARQAVRQRAIGILVSAGFQPQAASQLIAQWTDTEINALINKPK